MTITILTLINFLILILGFWVLRTMIHGAPYVPTKNKSVGKMIEFSKAKPGQKFVDLGSGDGRIVIAFARAGAIACGYEINPFLVWWSRRKIKKAGLEGKAFIYRKNFWDEDFSSFDIVALFGVKYIMKELGEKLKRELAPGAKVVSYGFKFPNWEYVKKEEGVILYEKK